MTDRYFWWMVNKIWPSEELRETVYRGPFRREFNWLYGSIFDELTDGFEYILDELNRIEFRSVVNLDENRVADARDLRARYSPAMADDVSPISVLEVLVALSIRCDLDIEGDPDYPEFTAPLWFWSMIRALFGDQFDDILGGNELEIRYYVDSICDRLSANNHIFEQNPRKKVDLWMQLNHWLTDNFGGNSVI